MSAVVGRQGPQSVGYVLDHRILVNRSITGSNCPVTLSAGPCYGAESRVVGMTLDAVTGVVVIRNICFIISRASQRLAGTVLMLTSLVVTDRTDAGGDILVGKTLIVTVDADIIGCT